MGFCPTEKLNLQVHMCCLCFLIKSLSRRWDLSMCNHGPYQMSGMQMQNIYSFIFRETEYKGLQLSLDQATSKASFLYSSSTTSSLMENCKTTKSRVSRPKTKARLSPYTQVTISSLTSLSFSLSLSRVGMRMCEHMISSSAEPHIRKVGVVALILGDYGGPMPCYWNVLSKGKFYLCKTYVAEIEIHVSVG